MTSTALARPISTADTIATLGLAGWIGTMAPATARAYGTDVRMFGEWLAQHGINPDKVTPGTTTAWLADLAAAGQSVATRRRKLAAVLSFYRFAAAEGADVTPPVPHRIAPVQRDDADAGAIDRHQARRLWDATQGQPRTRALVAVMLFSGLRVAEAVALQVSDLQTQDDAHVARVMGKGSKPRTAVLPAVAFLALQEWLTLRGDQPGPIFSTRTGAPMLARYAHLLVAKLGRSIGIEGLHPHSLRHTMATVAANAPGADLLKLATALGHASPSTTMRYIRGRDVITGSPVNAVADSILSG